jgi:hypothetical protein
MLLVVRRVFDFLRGQDSSATRLQDEWPRNHGLNPGRGKWFFFSPECPDQLLGITQPHVQWVMSVKQTEREADAHIHLVPRSMHGCIWLCAPICLCVHRGYPCLLLSSKSCYIWYFVYFLLILNYLHPYPSFCICLSFSEMFYPCQ